MGAITKLKVGDKIRSRTNGTLCVVESISGQKVGLVMAIDTEDWEGEPRFIGSLGRICHQFELVEDDAATEGK